MNEERGCLSNDECHMIWMFEVIVPFQNYGHILMEGKYEISDETHWLKHNLTNSSKIYSTEIRTHNMKAAQLKWIEIDAMTGVD